MNPSSNHLLPRLLVFSLAVWFASVGRIVQGQEGDAEDLKEKAIADRFVVVLEKNPRRGTALDKVYGYHVERGSLEQLIKDYRSKVTSLKGSAAGNVWLIIGLLESLRGQDAASVTALEQAEKLAPDSYLASYYLGQAMILVGQPDQAAAAMERSIQRKPAQADLLDIYQALGRVYQRAHKTDKALEVWNRLEKQFPNDVRVQEQIATTLSEEGEFAAALPRYQALVKNTKDKYRQSLYAIEAAELKVRTGKSDEAIKDFESLLGQLLPDNWLYREVRRRIESVYLRTDDQAGLIGYYEAWVKQHPKDIDAISRLARLLAGMGRTPEAQKWLESGLKLAPTNKELRHALIAQLVYEQKFREAIVQYEQLDKHEPNHPDTLRDWGRLLLKDTSLEEPARKQAAAAVWRRLTSAKPKDALIASQVAELFRQAEMTDEALELYQKAITLAPDQAQYREYLGEYYHALKRKDEALATWRDIATGQQRTAANLARLAEVLASFGYLAEAVPTNAEACQLDPRDFALQLKQADLLAQLDQHAESLQQLQVVQKLAANDEEREAWITRDLRELQALDQLQARIEQRSQDANNKDPELWYWLARAHESLRQLKEATAAIDRASALAPQSIPILMASARIYEAQNNLLPAIEINTRLATIDRRYRTEYLKQVATLEQKLGRKDKAIQAGRDLIASAPGNPDVYEFFSQLCFQLGESDEGLGALRRSVRVNPTEPKGLLLLASALGEQFRTSEAIELYWRAFEKAGNLEDRLGVVPKLTELYLQTNQLDRLLERLERQRREPNQQREMTICLAQAYQSAGDDGNARQELEKLLTDDTRDVQLLTQLVKLCEVDGDLEAAVKFQQQLLKSSPGRESTMRLAQLMMKSGDTDEASALMNRLSAEEKDPEAILKSIDALLAQGNSEQALAMAERITRDHPRNWEALYREGLILKKQKERQADARARFEAVLALNLNDDDQSLAQKSQLKKPKGGRAPTIDTSRVPGLLLRGQSSWQVRQAVGIDQENYYNGQVQNIWMPTDYGLARMAAMGFLQILARDEGKEEEFLKERREQGEQATSDRAMLDAYYFAVLSNQSQDTYKITKKLSQIPSADTGVKMMYLSSLAGRGTPAHAVDEAVETPDGEDPQAIRLPPLDEEELKHVVACFQTLNDDTAMINYGQSFLQIVMGELKRAGRSKDADEMLRKAIADAQTPAQIGSLLSSMVSHTDYETAMQLLDRLAKAKAEPSMPYTSPGGFNYAQYVTTPEYQAQVLAQLMASLARKKDYKHVIGLWDRYLETVAARREKERQEPAAARKQNTAQRAQYQQRGYVYVWRNGNQQYEALDFPHANDVYDYATIQMLRQVFVIYNDGQRSGELLQHFQTQTQNTKVPPQQKLLWKFGLGYLDWWLDNKDEALNTLVSALETIPDNQDLRFELASLHEKRGEFDVALRIVDALTPSDQQLMQKREIVALRMAVNTGNIDRARLAAERLFGLRLDSNLQVQLAQQMHQLGMHDQAEAVLSRAGRQAGNRSDVLATLMEQYQSQGKNDVATQIAHQLLRRSAGAARTGRNASSSNESGIRQQALLVLKRSGKLPDMIQKVESQLKNAPKSQRLIESLLEYYTANGDDKKAAEISARLAESKQDDPQFRYNMANNLANQGKYKEAVEHYKVAIKKEPKLLQNNAWQVINTFQNADQIDGLGELFADLDLKVFRNNPWELSNVISNLVHREKSKTQALALFRRAWKELPDQRSQLLSNSSDESFWQMPEMYDYARQGVIPTETSFAQAGAWSGFGNIQSWNNDGKITTLITRFLTIAQATKRLEELRGEVEASHTKIKKWEGGQVLLALIDLRLGKVAEAKPVLEKTLTSLKAQQGQYTRWELAQEMLPYEDCRDLAIRYLEAACNDPDLMNSNGFQYSPGKPLADLYRKVGRRADARRIMIEAGRPKPSRHRGNEDWEAYQRVQNTQGLGNEMLSMGYPVDALRLYQSQLSRTEDFAAVRRIYGGSSNNYGDQMKKQIEDGFQSALKQLTPDLLPELLSQSHRNPAEPASALDPANRNDNSFDMLLLIESRELSTTRLNSALGRLVSGLTARPELVEGIRAALGEATAASPDDLTTLVLAAQLPLTMKQPDDAKTAVQRLVEFAQRSPLPEKSDKGGFTQQQRDAALKQTSLWLVARDCLKQDALRSDGEIIGQRALDAARLQSDHGYVLAILREWGQLEFDAGHQDRAEQLWSEMLDVVIPRPAGQNKPPADTETSALPLPLSNPVALMARPAGRGMSRWEFILAPALVGQVVRSTPAAPGPPAAVSSSRGNVVTLAQFEQASQIAKLAADNGLNDLSLKAMTVALQAGPPIEAMQALDPNQQFALPRNDQNGEQSQLSRRVQERLAILEQLWRKKGVAEESIFQILKYAVLPESRPLEVFLYPRPLNVNPGQPPESVGSLFARTAVSTGHVDQVKQWLEPRMKQPLGELAARVLLTQIAIASHDQALADEQLTALSQRLQQDSLQTSSELACHAAIPALTLPAPPPSATTLFERAVGHFAQNASQMQSRGNLQEEPMRSYRFALARIQFANQNPAAAKTHLEEYLNYLTPIYSRYGGDYGQYRRRQELLKVAAEYARGGQRQEALDCLGRHADIAISRNYGNEWAGRAAATILTGLETLPAAERYTLLKTWSLPSPERKSVRLIGGMIPGDHAPKAFDSLRGAAPRVPQVSQLLSTATLLISAAAESKHLEELQRELEPHAEQNVENAKFLLLMTRIARGEGTEVTAALRQYLDERKAAGEKENPGSPPMTDIILAQSAGTDPGLRDTGREMALQFLTQASRVQNHLLMTIARREYYSPLLGADSVHRLNSEPWNTDLRHWTASALAPARNEGNGAVPMWWIAHDGVLAHVCGPDDSHLYFKYPLTGDFTVSLDSWLGAWAENNIGYGGIIYNGLNLGGDTQIVTVGNRADSLHKPDPPDVNDRYNAVNLEMIGDKVRYTVNGTLIHEEPRASSTAPWLLLQSNRVWYTAMRNIRITGKPVIPREVSLINQNSLLGWVTEFYGESQPVRESRTVESNGAEQPEYDWQAKDGVLYGRIQPYSGLGKSNVQQSRLHYDRPLLDRETIRYEFWYEAGPNGCLVAPALDRLAFLIEEGGVKLHWMTDGNSFEDGYTGLTESNALTDKSLQRGNVQLKDQAWNTVEFSLHEDAVSLTLNGTLIATRMLEPDNNRQFGFYHDKHETSVRVRNVVLTGDWPKSLTEEIRGDLLAPAHSRTPQERRQLAAVIDEKFHAEGLGPMLQQTRALEPAKQFAALKAWVLPNDDHDSIRLYGELTPVNGLPAPNPVDSARFDAPAESPTVRRQIVGGEIFAPVFDLIAVAKSLQRLDELAPLVAPANGDSPKMVRSKTTIRLLLAAAKGDFDVATTEMNQLHGLYRQVPEDAPAAERWPELIAVDEALRHPELRSALLPFLNTMVELLHKKSIGEPWEVRVVGLRDRCRAILDKELARVPGDTSPKGQWIPARVEWANANARGPAPYWSFREEGISHVGGFGHDYLYFQSPLRGSFSAVADVSSYGWRETRLMYHGHWIGPQYTRTVVDVGDLVSSWHSPKIDPPLEFEDWCEIKLNVQPGKATFSIGDRIVHEQALPEHADPWLAVQTWGNLSGGVRRIRITGQPEIPDELNLSGQTDLLGWTTTLYQEAVTQDENTTWLKSNDEIVGKKFDASAGRKRQSLLRYHRPLLEDAVVKYDFYYVPNQTHVHPALGRQAFLIDPDGVKLHWLTDAQWDRSGLPSGNALFEAANQRGPKTLPFKENDWNHLELSLVGDQLQLQLNGTAIYEAAIPLSNQRQLGLFHFADETDVRVKNVTYRGNWPKTLPSLKEQEYSGAGPRPYEFGEDELTTQLEWDFQGPKPSFLKLWGAAKPNRMEPVEGGLKMVRPEKAGEDAIPCGFQWDTDIKGDFEATLSFRDFRSITEQTDWQIPRIELFFNIGGGWGARENTHLYLGGMRRRVDKKIVVYSGLGTHQGEQYNWKYSTNEIAAEAGQLRFVRKGATAYVLFLKPGTEDWMLLNKGPVSDAPLKGGNLCLRAEMPTSSGEVVFTGFTLKSREKPQK